uniref:Uncharacterized protein n=1 Tax=Cucumis melo TaxID=3656 RepID=A0A9I9EJU9_CUCME
MRERTWWSEIGATVHEGSTARKSAMDVRGGSGVCGGADKSIDIPVVVLPKLVREHRL